MKATNEPWNAPIATHAGNGEDDRDETREPGARTPAAVNCATTTPATPLT